VIEVAPAMPLTPEESKWIQSCAFADNLFMWEKQPDGLWSLAIVTGLGMLFNHSYKPNAFYDCDTKRNTVVFSAIRPIRRGKEIFVNYNGEPEDQTPIWFRPV